MAFSAICLNDCTDPESIKKSQVKKKSKVILKPMNEIIAPKAFQATILEGKTRGSRLRAQNSDLEINSTNQKGESKEPNREGPFVNDMAELLFMLDGEKIEESEDESMEEEKTEIKSESEDHKEEQEEIIEDDFKQQRCHECPTIFNSKQELLCHFSAVPLKSQRNAFGKFLWSLELPLCRTT